MSETTDTNTTLVAHQMNLERLFSKNQLLPRIRSGFQDCTEIDFVGVMVDHDIPVAFGVDVLAQIALHKRANLPTMIGVLFHHLGDAQKTADMLLNCVACNLLVWNAQLRVFIVIYEVPPDVQEELDRFQYPLPMVVEPKPVSNNKQSGYFLHAGSIILKNNHHDEDVCLDHINRLNRVRFSVNMNVVRFVKNKWKGLDKHKPHETREKYEQRVRAFRKYDRTAKDVIEILVKHSDTFHLTHKYDKRGRTYSMGYHVNYQGNDWCKATIEFADKELVV